MNPALFKTLGEFILKNWKYLVYLYQLIAYILKLTKKKPMNPNVEALLDKLVKYVDDKTNTGIVDPIDQMLLKKLLVSAWGLLEKEAPEKLIDALEYFSESIMTGNDEELIKFVTEFINGEVDIPGMDETAEGDIIYAVLVTIAVTLRGLATK